MVVETEQSARNPSQAQEADEPSGYVLTALLRHIMIMLRSMPVNKLHQVCLADKTNLGCLHLTILKQNQGRDATHTKLWRGRRVTINIQLNELDLAIVFLCDIFQNRG